MIAAIVPFRGGEHTKSRLRDALSNADRLSLAHSLLRHVLSVLEKAPDIRIHAVVSPETIPNAYVIQDDGIGLNQAIAIGTQWATDKRASAVLILPADLPLLSVSDIETLVSLLPRSHGGVVAPSKDGGTGALALRPPRLIEPSFGKGSALRHMELIRAAGAEAREVYRTGVALDVDEPRDLSILGSACEFGNVGRGPR